MLCGARAFAPVWVATFVAAKRPVFHTGERHVSTAGSLAPGSTPGGAAAKIL